MSPPVAPQFDPQKAWEALVAKGVSKQEASQHVLRQVLNQPREIAAQFLKDVDPGKLAAFGLGMADMMSFGLGDQIARKLDQEAEAAGLEGNGAALTQAAAKELHGTAHTVGEVAGVLTPIGAEVALSKAGVMAPMALTKFIQAIRNPYLRWAGRTGASAAEGAALAGAQAAGRNEGDLGERLTAAGEAAPFGAVAGAVLPNVIPGAKVAANRLFVRPSRYVRNILTDIMEGGAGKYVPSRELPNIKMDLTPEGVGSLQPVRRPASGDPLDVPTFKRREIPPPEPQNAASAEIDRLLMLLRRGRTR